MVACASVLLGVGYGPDDRRLARAGWTALVGVVSGLGLADSLRLPASSADALAVTLLVAVPSAAAAAWALQRWHPSRSEPAPHTRRGSLRIIGKSMLLAGGASLAAAAPLLLLTYYLLVPALLRR